MNNDDFYSKSSPDETLEIQHEGLDARLQEYYDHAATRLGHLLSINHAMFSTVKSVKVLGSPNSRTGFLKDVVKPALVMEDSSRLKDSLDRLAAAADRLAKFGIYDAVTLEVDEATNVDADRVDLHGTIRLKEKSRLWARTGTDFGNQEGSAYLSANVRNVFGGAETLEGNMSFGTRTKTSYDVKFRTPILADPDTIVELLAYNLTRTNSYASHDELAQGLTGKLQHSGRFGVNELSILATTRRITNLHAGASMAIRQCAGTANKISLIHNFIRDRRDDPVLPTSGYRLKSTQELAGIGPLGGSACFAKFELDASKHIAITQDRKSIFNMAFKSGLAWNLHSENKLHLSDRFQLGGPQSVRGFMYNGLGPRSGRDSLGGDIYLATGCSILSPVPRAPVTWPVFLHTFVNTGSLFEVDKNDLGGSISQVLCQPSVGAGLGLVFRHPIARVEMSFCLPIVTRCHDRTRKGLQFGLGLEFL